MSSSPDQAGNKKRIFLVDDHPLVREWLTQLIHQQADLIVCGEAETCLEALQAIIITRPDVAIVDISLKDASGIELIKDLAAQSPQTVVLVLSMHEEAHYAERVLRAGAKGYVMKRETAKKVIAAIRQVLAGQVYISEPVATHLAARAVGARATTDWSPISGLSDRELEVFEMLGQGKGTRDIAETLHVSLKTVQAYCARIKEKLRLKGATELLREAVRWHDRARQT